MLTLILIFLALATPEQTGKELFVRRCSGCHAADLDKEGPRLRGVYGRKAAAVPGFSYSEAVKEIVHPLGRPNTRPLANRSRRNGAGYRYGLPPVQWRRKKSNNRLPKNPLNRTRSIQWCPTPPLCVPTEPPS